MRVGKHRESSGVEQVPPPIAGGKREPRAKSGVEEPT